jgi:hypothetical protein
VYQHRARIEKLLDVEALQPFEKAPRSVDVYFLVKRVVLAGKIEVGGEVDYRCDSRTETLAHGIQSFGDGLG